MKMKCSIVVGLVLLIVCFSCKKYNPEDQWFSHGGKHLNDRQEGEWELVGLHINEQDLFNFSKNDVFIDFSNLLEIDTMNIAKFFKFVPAHKQSKVEGTGDLYIRTKNMTSYPEKIGISQSLVQDLTDSNFAIANLNYQFHEGKGKNFFRIGFSDIFSVDTLISAIPVFKPFDEYFVFNNFFIKNHSDFYIMKATKKELILFNSAESDKISTSNPHIFYRLTFKKIN